MRRHIILLHLLVLIPPVKKAVLPAITAPGSDITLSCFFPHHEIYSPLNLIVGWQRGDSEVVHSYYKGDDKLETQSSAYRGRTQLFPDQLAVGNASLRLTGVQVSDQGKYTCDIANERGRFQVQIVLMVAAPYEEPQLAFQATCDSIILTFCSALGFPEATVLWRSGTGSDMTNQSNTALELKDGGKHYEVRSKMVLKPSELQKVTFELRLDLLNQSFSRSVTLHPLPACGEVHLESRNRLVFLFWFVPLMVLACLLIAVFWSRAPENDPDVPMGTVSDADEE